MVQPRRPWLYFNLSCLSESVLSFWQLHVRVSLGFSVIAYRFRFFDYCLLGSPLTAFLLTAFLLTIQVGLDLKIKITMHWLLITIRDSRSSLALVRVVWSCAGVSAHVTNGIFFLAGTCLINTQETYFSCSGVKSENGGGLGHRERMREGIIHTQHYLIQSSEVSMKRASSRPNSSRSTRPAALVLMTLADCGQSATSISVTSYSDAAACENQVWFAAIGLRA